VHKLGVDLGDQEEISDLEDENGEIDELVEKEFI